jgi:hypothetical protein
MVGDLQGIAGEGMPEFSSVDMPLLDVQRRIDWLSRQT